jgi:uncharacterized lipoprotein YddW (UPF0748 family)
LDFAADNSSLKSGAGPKDRLLWCDAEANLEYLTCRERVAETVRRCREANIDTIILDVKPLSGHVLYKSSIAPRIEGWKDFRYPSGYDLLRVMLDEGHGQGVSVQAAVNVFSEGSQELKGGPAYAHPEWQCVRYELNPDTGKPHFIRVADAPAEHLAVFVNPILPEVQEYELSIAEEIARNYEVDGVVFDRMRYPNIQADFSDVSLASFDDFVGGSLRNWPEDVFRIATSPDQPVIRGPLFREWCEWRAKQIRDHFAEAQAVVKAVRSSALAGVYVGSWYSQYYHVGVNWGSSRYRPQLDWTAETYHTTGYAEIADYLCAGCYYEIPSREEARSAGLSEGLTVEAGAEEAMMAVMGATTVYGSLYVRQYQGDPDRFRRAIRAATAGTQGLMLFDLVHIRDYDWWPVVIEELNRAP